MATDIYENRPQSFLTNIEPIANQMQNIALATELLAQLKGDIEIWICLLNLMMEKVVQRKKYGRLL
jgi:hypothetical protein